jgi:hypothetical protein
MIENKSIHFLNKRRVHNRLGPSFTFAQVIFSEVARNINKLFRKAIYHRKTIYFVDLSTA